MNNPYAIRGTAVVSVSGGRTSGFMLAKILEANSGALPADVVPVFTNTGREHEATLLFLKQMAERWSVPIVWLEYRFSPEAGVSFTVVDYCTASRNGEPFAALIRQRKMLPNPVMRFCTSELKIRTVSRYVASLGWTSHDRAVGLRADEPRRVARMRGDTKNENVVLPMAVAGHTLDDVRAFWAAQPFDLALPANDNAFGNCDLCFLKSRAKIEKVIHSMPERADWWAYQESAVGATFRRDRPTYQQMKVNISVQGRLIDDAIEDDTLPCNCTD